MKQIAILVGVLALVGCGITPPRPPECAGPLVPINTPAEQR